MEEKKEYLVKLFEDSGLFLSEKQAGQLILFHDLLEDRNRVMNLTAIRGFEEAAVKHFLDSAMLLKFIGGDGTGDETEALTMIDVGTGAGFPGIPLKILRPEWRITLLDALQKRIGFLNEVIRSCALEDVETLHARAEEAVKDRRECYDMAVSRAVAYLPALLEYCLPLVREGGRFIAYKSGEVDGELSEASYAIEVLGGELEKVEKFELPDGSARSLIFVRKVGETPEKYPRRPGKIEKAPLVMM